MNSQYISKFVLIIAAALLVGACNDSANTPFPKPNPPSNNSHVDEPIGGVCGGIPFKTYDEAIDGGHYSFAYGTIVKTEPVLDLFDWNSNAGEGRKTCDGDIDPALRITVRLENASWDFDAEDLLTVGVSANVWGATAASPHVNAGKKGIEWSDGHTYFQSGDSIGMLGAFSKHEDFRVASTNFFTIDKNGAISNFRQSNCVKGELNNVDVNEVIARSHTANHGEKPYIKGELGPLNSACTE